MVRTSWTTGGIDTNAWTLDVALARSDKAAVPAVEVNDGSDESTPSIRDGRLFG
jgi:hypothetical protein